MSSRRIGPVAIAALLIAVTASTLPATPPAPTAVRDTAVFAGGCFWGVQAVYERVKGVTSSISGYAGGHTSNPTYDEVSTGTTGYAESVQVIYDPAVVSYDQLLDVFFSVAHDPTQLDRQGPDEGTQYRSAIFYRNAEQQRAALAFKAKLTADRTYSRPIVTEITALGGFHPAEAYHQNFYDTHPTYGYIVANDKPKVEHLRKQFPTLYLNK